MLNTAQNSPNFGEKQDIAIWQLFQKVVPLFQKWSGMITDHSEPKVVPTPQPRLGPLLCTHIQTDGDCTKRVVETLRDHTRKK